MSSAFPTKTALFFGAIGVLGASISATAQMIVPVDQHFPPPNGLSFAGRWECDDKGSAARLYVAEQPARANKGGHWTKIRETEEGFSGNYLVGFDRDKSRFLIIDADDPAVSTYRTEGWSGSHLVLHSSERQGQITEPVRIEFEVGDSRHFTVSWERLNGSLWEADAPVTCMKLDSR